MNPKEFLWIDKYAPKSIDECIIPESVKVRVNGMIEKGDIQNILFHSSPGTGKSTLARLICIELDFDYIFINGSKEGRLMETVRNIVTPYVNSLSIDNKNRIKVVIYDEFDNSGKDVQMAMRGVMDSASSSCRFIFTGNFVSKIIEPIHSRTTVVDFSVPHEEKPAIMTKILGRVCDILNKEGVKYDSKVLSQYIFNTFPDFRRIINELQSYSSFGKIDKGILSYAFSRYDTLVEHILNKDFSAVIAWTSANYFDSDIYSLITKRLFKKIETASWLETVILADKYQYRHTYATDTDITLWAFCSSVMALL